MQTNNMDVPTFKVKHLTTEIIKRLEKYIPVRLRNVSHDCAWAQDLREWG